MTPALAVLCFLVYGQVAPVPLAQAAGGVRSFDTLLAAKGHHVLAIDADPNPNLGISLGLGVEQTTALTGAWEALDANGGALPESVEDVVDQFATDAGERLRLLQIWKLDYFKPT